ncbi:MAG: molybdenum cofactor guanylyltransferase [Bacteroidales bacterium]|nr:molybdenum cofactor guanylyltransferase [Bacteroidales bacterium]
MNNSINNELTGIILAGGKGIRLGLNKGMANLMGRPMIEYVIENLEAVCDHILISSNTSQCAAYGYDIIADIYEGKGPMAGIHACLKASTTEHNIVISVDTPFAGPDFIRYMINNKAEGLAAAPWFGMDHYEPLCAYYNKQIVVHMEAFFRNGNFKLPDLFLRIPFTPLLMPEKATFNHPMLFHNINTKADLRLAETYLERKNERS